MRYIATVWEYRMKPSVLRADGQRAIEKPDKGHRCLIDTLLDAAMPLLQVFE